MEGVEGKILSVIYLDSYINSDRGTLETTDAETGEVSTVAQEAIRYRVINRNYVKLYRDFTQTMNLFIHSGVFDKHNWLGRKIVDH